MALTPEDGSGPSAFFNGRRTDTDTLTRRGIDPQASSELDFCCVPSADDLKMEFHKATMTK